MPDTVPSLDQTSTSDASIRAKLALEAGRMGSWIWNVEQNALTGDELAAQFFGLDHAAQPWSGEEINAMLNADDIPAVDVAMQDAVKNNIGYQVEFRRKNHDGPAAPDEERWYRSRGHVSEKSASGQATKFIGVIWDVTNEKLHDKAVTLIAGDMDHRAKNAFAVIRAMINLGKRTSTDVATFADTLRIQVEAMASGHSLAARVSRKTEVSLAPISLTTLIETTLQPWSMSITGGASHISISGSQALRIGADKVNSLSMILAQFAQRSQHDGVLSDNDGHIEISVQKLPSGDLEIIWDEQTSAQRPMPALDSADQFGDILLSHCVSTLLGNLKRDDTQNRRRATITLPE